jgi:hypothetical protein
MAWWIQLIVLVFLTVLMEILRPKPEFTDAKPSGIGDFQLPTASEDRRVPLLWGTVKVKGPNVVWYGDLYQQPIIEEVQTGFFSKEEFIKGFRYYMGVQLVFCEGPIDGFRRLWIGEDMVADGTTTLFAGGDLIEINEPSLFGGDELGSGGYVGTFQVFDGSSSQAASTYLTQFVSESGVMPAYRGYAYLAPQDLDLVDPSIPRRHYLGNSTSIEGVFAEVQRIATPEANGLGLADPYVNDLDANPMNVIYECMTNQRWGMGIAPSEIDTAGFEAAAEVLRQEGNGFSMIVDRQEEIGAMVERVCAQIDGVIYYDLGLGKWSVNLARDDFDVATIPHLELGENVLSVETFTRGTWQETVNIYKAGFVDRADDYKKTSATAQNDANLRIQNGRQVGASDFFPGVKDGTLADNLAWRDIRTLSTPLAQARVVVDRSAYLINPIDAVKLSFTSGGLVIDELVMRVKQVDRGRLEEGKITLDLVENVFRATTGGFGPPPGTAWEPPSDDLDPFPVAEQVAIEAPRAITARDLFGNGPTDDKVYAFARQQSVASQFVMRARHSSGTPSGDYADIGTCYGFCKIGELASALTPSSTALDAILSIDSTPDGQATLLATLPNASADAPTPEAIGIGLRGLILVGDEWMLVSYAVAGTGTEVNLRDVYRGALDSVQGEHAIGTPVYFAFTGANTSNESIPAGHNVDVLLLPRSYSDTVTEGEATAISFAMQNRTRRPYPPTSWEINSLSYPASVSLEAGGTGESDGIPMDFIRRDFRTGNEVESLLTDAATLYTDFPTINNTTHEVVVIDDPSGTPTTILTYDLGSAASGEVPRLEILKATDGVLPTELEFRLRSRHDFDGTSYTSLYELEHSFTVTSALTGQFNFGALDTLEWSASYTADAAGRHSFTLSSSFATGNVTYRLNGGSSSTLIAAGATVGSISGVSIGDTIEVRHQSSIAGSLKLLSMTAASGGTDAYAILYV